MNEEPKEPYVKFLHKTYGEKMAKAKWAYYNPYGFFSKMPLPGGYKVKWETYNGKTVEVY